MITDKSILIYSERFFIRTLKDFIYLTNKSKTIEVLLSLECEVFVDALNNVGKSLEELCSLCAISSDDIEKFIGLLEHLCKVGVIRDISIDNNESCNVFSYDTLLSTGNGEVKERLMDYFVENPIPWTATLELTTNCNLDCIHCYNTNDGSLLSKDSAYSILKQLRQLGTLNIILTGGEPLLHPDFCDILTCCSEFGFIVSIFTNAVLLNDDIIDKMVECSVAEVQISVYSLNSECHNSITQRQSFELTMKNILKLKAKNFDIVLSTPITNQNYKEIENISSFALSKGLIVRFALDLLPKSDPTISNASSFLNITQYMEAHKSLIDMGIVFSEDNSRSNIKRRGKLCFAGFNTISIAANMKVHPCSTWKSFLLGNLNHLTISEVWFHSHKIKELREMNSIFSTKLTQCVQCDLSSKCKVCMARNQNTTGSPFLFSDIFCEKRHIFFK